MLKRNNQIAKLLGSSKTPLLAAYRPSMGFPNEVVIASFECKSCDTPVSTNNMPKPCCPNCGKTDLVASGSDPVTFNKKDYEVLTKLGECEVCACAFVTTPEVSAKLQGETFKCIACRNPISVIESDDAAVTPMDNSADADTSKDEKVTDKDYSPKADEATDGDKELKEILDKMSTENDSDDSDDKNDDDATPTPAPKKENKKPDAVAPTDETTAPAETTSSEDNELISTLALYRANLKNGKKFQLVANNNFENWYMFDKASPIAIASYENVADESVKRIFHSNDFVTVFESAIASDGGANEQLMEDFGFEPVKVNFDIDDVSNNIINEKVKESTQKVEEKLTAISELFEQALGTACVGSIKGMFNEENNLREAFIAKLISNRVRDPELMVDDVLAKEMPEHLRFIVTKAKELMAKSPEALQDISATFRDAKPRMQATASAKNKEPIVPFSILSSEVDNDYEEANQEKSNFVKKTNVDRDNVPVTASLLLKNVVRGSMRKGGSNS